MSGFAKNIGLIIFLNLVIKPLGILLEMIIQSRMGSAQFGVYASLYSLGYLLYAFSDLGINQYLTKSIAEEPEKAKELFPKLLMIKLGLSVAYPFLMIGVGFLLQYEAQNLFYLALLSFGHAFIQVNLFFRSNFQGFQLFKLDAFASNIDKILFIAVMGILLWGGWTQLDDFVYSRVAAIAFTFLLLLGITLSKGLWHKPKVHWPEIKPILKASFPFALITILYSINEKVDQVMVERIHNDSLQAGIYSAAYRWVDAIMMYLWIVLPMFFAKLAHHETDHIHKGNLVKTGTVITAIPFILICVAVVFHGEHLFVHFEKFSTNEVSQMTACFQVICIGLLLHGFFAILSTYLTSNGHTRMVNISLIISIVINMILNIIFIPQYGAKAAAATTAFSTLFISLCYIIYIAYHKLIPLPFGNWFKLTLFAMLFGGLLKAGVTLNIHWLVSIITASFIALVFAFGIKLIRKSDLKSM